jgi:hypothetical protein
MPFGVTNRPATFQRFINMTLGEYLDDFATTFIDDILIYSKTKEEHIEHVRKVLQRLQDAGLQASLGKCEFHTQTTRFLGFIIGTDGIKVDPEKIAILTAHIRESRDSRSRTSKKLYNYTGKGPRLGIQKYEPVYRHVYKSNERRGGIKRTVRKGLPSNAKATRDPYIGLERGSEILSVSYYTVTVFWLLGERA